MSNQTIIAVPTNVTNEAELRLFLTRLVTEVDKIVGYRQTDELSLQSLDKRISELENTNE